MVDAASGNPTLQPEALTHPHRGPDATGPPIHQHTRRYGERAIEVLSNREYHPSPNTGAAALDPQTIQDIATRIAAASIRQAIEDLLGFLLQRTQADAAEILLAEQAVRELVLAYHVGQAREAFAQIARFRPGQGVPGTVWAENRAILCDPLPSDSRFVRSAVKQAGFQCYFGAPIPSSRGSLGAIGLAFRSSPDFHLVEQVAFTAATWLGLRIEAVMASWQSQGLAAVLETLLAEPPEGRARLTAFLAEVARQVGASQVELYSVAPLPLFSAFPFRPLPACPIVATVDFGRCPAARDRQTTVLSSLPHERAIPCRLAEGGGNWYCTPVLFNDRVFGLLRCRQEAEHALFPPETITLVELVTSALAEALHLLDGRAPSENPQPTRRIVVHDRPRIALRCFGSFEVAIDGQPVDPRTVPRRRVLQLLRMLAVHYHRFLPRDVLIDWLWERDDATEHTTQFFVIVHELRRLLAGSETERAHPVIIRDGDRYQLTLGSDVWLDLAEFDRLLEIARRADTAGDRLSAIDAYSRAVDLYRDDLLADEPYAEWCWMERERRREQCIAALRQLARAWSAMGQWDSSIVALRRALELDRFREDIHRELMRALWAAGRRAEAIRQFAECARLLRQELGMEPDPETLALLDQIRRSPHSS